MKRLSRRHLLALAGTGALAGCLDRDVADPSTGTGSDPPSGDEADYPRSSSNGADGDGDFPACPDYENADRVVCYDAADDAESVVLEPSTRTVSEGSSIEFTLDNGSDERLMTNFYNWRVDKHVGGEWYRVAPLFVNQPLMSVDSGDSHAWTVTPDNDGIGDVDRFRGESATESIELAGVGAGVYAFRARGWFEDGRSEEILAFAATFELEGEPLTLTPTAAISAVEWESDDGDRDGDGDSDTDADDVLVARSDRGEDGEHQRLGAYELDVLDEPTDDARSVITEQVVRNDQLRDAIALAKAYDAGTVRIEEYNGITPIFGSDTDGIYEYQGTYYRVRTRELEDG